MAFRETIETGIAWVLIVSSVLFVVSLAGAGSGMLTDDAPAANPYSDAPADTSAGPSGEITTGLDVYTTNCATCHGDDLSGGIGPAIGPGSAVAGASTAELRSIIESGPGTMPAFAGRLQPAEIDALIAFLLHAGDG